MWHRHSCLCLGNVQRLMLITATAPGASWDKPGAEGTVATIYLDGKYNQDLLIVRGAKHLFAIAEPGN